MIVENNERDVNPVQNEAGGAKRLPTSFSPVTSTNEESSPQNLLTFSFNTCQTCIKFRGHY